MTRRSEECRLLYARAVAEDIRRRNSSSLCHDYDALKCEEMMKAEADDKKKTREEAQAYLLPPRGPEDETARVLVSHLVTVELVPNRNLNWSKTDIRQERQSQISTATAAGLLLTPLPVIGLVRFCCPRACSSHLSNRGCVNSYALTPSLPCSHSWNFLRPCTHLFRNRSPTTSRTYIDSCAQELPATQDRIPIPIS